MSLSLSPKSHPITSLILLFTAYKALLLSIALSAPGPGYDTSTTLFFSSSSSYSFSTQNLPLLPRQLTRWDALYFIHATSHSGSKLYEQEWAFGHATSLLTLHLTSLLQNFHILPSSIPHHYYATIAISISHLSHLLSVLSLHHLTTLIFASPKIAFITATLHIITPAGLFLSSPYAEALFSLLSFIGKYLFALSYTTTTTTHSSVLQSLRRASLIISAGAIFGLATWFRSNGLANGLLFAVEALRYARKFLTRPSVRAVVAVIPILVGGVLVAAGSVVPQYFAWKRYCSLSTIEDVPLRPWCSDSIPSIYGFVQDHYWNVGFLRYWTLPQLPLFLLAIPVLTLLISSGLHFCLPPTIKSTTIISPTLVYLSVNPRLRAFVQTLALGQVLVAALAITHYHVQVITRLASGYVVWYWWIAGCLCDNRGCGRIGRAVVIFMVMYGCIQGGLFASFLPPA